MRPRNTETGYISRDPSICGGKPCIGGTRVRVSDVYVWHEVQRRSVWDIVALMPQLTPAQVHAALSYYWDHQDEVRSELATSAERLAAASATSGPSRLDPFRDGKGTDAAEVSPR